MPNIYRMKTGGCDFVSTQSYLEKVELDLIEFREVGMYILVSIDYHIRMVWGQFYKTNEQVLWLDF
jgi:hypothetical protein